MKQIYSVQEWLPFQSILEKGIIKLKDNTYIKIIKVIPINFNLKSDLEKEAILNSYKIFLKTCNFDLQIFIQSNKEDLSKHILNLKNQFKNETQQIIQISEKYIQYIQKVNKEKKSSTKSFFIVVKNSQKTDEDIIIEDLNDKYYKIKECLSRCGNIVISYTQPEEVKQILKSLLNSKEYF